MISIPALGFCRGVPPAGIVPAKASRESGGLMAYGPNILASFRQAAAYFDKIFRGANPADLPVETPTTFD